MLSIISVNWNADDFADLLKESLDLYTHNAYELILVNNNQVNLGHGEGLNQGVLEATERYTMFLDIDCHVLTNGWDEYFLNFMEEYDVVGGRGVPAKPIRPACMIMKTEIARRYDWRATPNYQGNRITPQGYDVAIKAYHQMYVDKVKVKLIDSIPSRYKTLNGEEWVIDGVPVCYHHWHGASLNLPSIKADFPNDDLMADKQKLFNQIPWKQFQLF